MATTKGTKKELTAEQKRENFKAAASKRTSRCIKAIRSLAGVARVSRYAWNASDTEKILNAIGAELDSAAFRLRNPQATKRGGDVFSL